MKKQERKSKRFHYRVYLCHNKYRNVTKWQSQFHKQLYQIDSHGLKENQFNSFSKRYNLKCFVKEIRQEQDKDNFLPRQGSSAAEDNENVL